MSLKSIHDKMLEDKPESAEHDAAECPFCTAENNGAQNSNEPGGRMSDKTYSEDEVKALVTAGVADATAALQTELAEFKSSEESQAVEARIAQAQADADAKVSDLQGQLDAAVIEASAAKTAREELETLITETAEAERLAAEVEARKDERKTQVAAVASFPEDYIEANADRWAGMSDEDFEASLADYKAVAEKASAGSSGSGDGVPSGTALTASRDDAGKGKGFAATREAIRLRESGVDLRELTR